MDRHYTLTQFLFPGGHGSVGESAEKFTFGVVLGLVILILGSLAASRIKSKADIENNLVPERKVSLFSLFDAFTAGFLAFHDSVLGKKNRKYYPLHFTIFIFLLFANLIGLIPMMPAITTTVWINVGLALLVFIAFNIYGFKELGVKNYLKHFAGGDDLIYGFSGLIKNVFVAVGAAIPFAVIVFLIEIFSISLRVLTLNLRIFWNIAADHAVIAAIGETLNGFFILVGPLLLAKGLLVSVVQAGVFTILTMVYILLATQHGEDH